MIRKLWLAVFLMSLLPSCVKAADTKAQNEFRPGEIMYDTDGNPINAHWAGVTYYHGVYYMYGSIMKGETVGHHVPLAGVSCYTSRDLYHWKNEGVVMPPVIDQPGSDIVPPRFVEREKVIYNPKTHKFVMWFHIDTVQYQYAHAGVAVAEHPLGPFRYLGSMRPNDSDCRDMTFFRAHDGKAYLIYSSEGNQTMHIAQLTDDYLKPNGKMIRIFEGKFREAPAVFEYKHRFYLYTSKCAGWAPTEAIYAVSHSMLGSWKVMGDPMVGPGADTTFDSQGTFILPVEGKRGAFIFMSDRWKPHYLADSRYIWLPIKIDGDHLEIKWRDRWDLSVFR